MPDETSRIDFSLLDARFYSALTETVSGTSPTTVLYSGGLDSSILAAGAATLGPVELYVLAFPNGRDLLAARTGARRLGLPLHEITPTRADVVRMLALPELCDGSIREPELSVQVATALAVKDCPSEILLVGQGADELFGGYAHFRLLDTEAAAARRRADWEKLTRVDWPLSRTIAHALGKDLRAPFLDRAFSECALGCPIERVGPTALTKPVLRAWARHRGVPEEIVGRPKVAFQFGSGVARAVRSVRRAASTSPPGGLP